ncbi:hypothetical protein MTBBW1_1940009 [Desulfamplus magnetovallimortis]|uniref:Uncharacterized protein n=1 Tax=Desulfamplus magnetovallimortis TaxID=1246637 RepID=A0A1W1HB99_9BACT|nr:hypothetical protein [Desulfamplus magnetovallimortis]SLM29682.1 hypothetical protein MTBBW1_1940009 [Desulfamplus magnetovallimortis]
MPYLVNLGNPDSDSVDKAYKIIGVDFQYIRAMAKQFVTTKYESP